ncbi:hypothetical protein OAO87_02750 [bacterium]|nr:hypothetical protein [bacterium]
MRSTAAAVCVSPPATSGARRTLPHLSAPSFQPQHCAQLGSPPGRPLHRLRGVDHLSEVRLPPVVLPVTVIPAQYSHVELAFQARYKLAAQSGVVLAPRARGVAAHTIERLHILIAHQHDVRSGRQAEQSAREQSRAPPSRKAQVTRPCASARLATCAQPPPVTIAGPSAVQQVAIARGETTRQACAACAKKSPFEPAIFRPFRLVGSRSPTM